MLPVPWQHNTENDFFYFIIVIPTGNKYFKQRGNNISLDSDFWILPSFLYFLENSIWNLLREYEILHATKV